MKPSISGRPVLTHLHLAEKDRFGERTMVERVYRRLKDKFGGFQIRVSGHGKIMAHLGVPVLTTGQILRLST